MKTVILIGSVLVAMVWSPLLARDNVSKEERLMQLKLQEARIKTEQAETSYREAAAKYEQMVTLKERGVITGDELNTVKKECEEARVSYEQAKIDLEKTDLAFLSNATTISVVQAYKYRSVDGQDMARILLKNTSNLERARAGSNAGEGDLAGLLNLKGIRVSLLSNGVLVGSPYEIIVPSLAYGAAHEAVFALREKDLSAVTLQLKYLEQVDTRDIYLEKRSAFDIVSVSSQQFSQEGLLGRPVSFDLTLERLAEDENTYALEVFNLPPQYKYAVLMSDKRVSQIKFARGTSKLDAVLEVYVPENVDKAELDQAIPFLVAVAEQSKMQGLTGRNTALKAEDLKTEQIGFDELELIPRGVGELELYLANLYLEINRGQNAVSPITLKNTGTVALNDIEFKADVPADWECRTEPKMVRRLQPGEEARLELTIVPPRDVEPGKMEATLNAVCQYQDQQIESTEKNISIIIKSKTNLVGSILLIILLVGMVVGVAVVTIRISRR